MVRTYIKVKVTENPDVRDVREIMRLWAKMRQTPRNLIRAIKLYEALRIGDPDYFRQLLADFFPGFALAAAFAPSPSFAGSFPAVAPRPSGLVISHPHRTAEELDAEAADEFGFGELEF